MKCPNCQYEDGWNPNKLEYVEGELGVFFRLQLDMQRNPDPYSVDRRAVYGCPNCNNIFIGNTL